MLSSTGRNSYLVYLGSNGYHLLTSSSDGYRRFRFTRRQNPTALQSDVAL